ncbi:hypothetical protein SNE40_020479 [Patella caerulea]|uniref:2'-5'-oligoadenylate synthetase 1 domain-containing protein n=1 Tax=Patella caerulea TaxID=87958 RepID=A0AAN8G4I8_PATCE
MSAKGGCKCNGACGCKVKRSTSAKVRSTSKAKTTPEKTEKPSRQMSAKVKSPPDKTEKPPRETSAKLGSTCKVKSSPDKTEKPHRKMNSKESSTCKENSSPEKTEKLSRTTSAKVGSTCKVKSPPEKREKPPRSVSAKVDYTCIVKSPTEKTEKYPSMKLSEYLPKLGKETLEEFVERYLNVSYKARMNQTIDQLQRHLQNLPGYSIGEVFRGGSMAKCTAVKTTADIDLIVFFDGYRNMQDFIADKEKDGGILQTIESHLTTVPVLSNSWKCTKIAHPYNVTLKMDGCSIRVDILPARQFRTAALNSMYNEIKRQPASVRPHYSVCFARTQCEFMRRQPRQVHYLVKLLKYWKSENVIGLKSYFLELLAVHIFKTKLGKDTKFDLQEGFRLALIEIQNYNSLEITFDDYYRPETWKDLRPCKPYVMDPANPFMNTCYQHLDSRAMDRMVTCATNTILAITNPYC